MAKSDKLHDITDNVAKFIATVINKFKELFEKLKKMDRRFLILVCVAVVLVIVMLILIINGIAKSGDEDKPIDSEGSSNISEPSTDAEPEDTLQLNGAGTYKVKTGTSPYLNMRLAADRDSAAIGQIPNGTTIEVLFVDDSEVEEGGEYGWGYVDYDRERGWVYMEYLVK